MYYSVGKNPVFDQQLMDWVNTIRSKARLGASPPKEFVMLDHLLHDAFGDDATAEPEVDLVNDPDERVNRAEDPAMAARIRELKGLMEEWFTRYANPCRDGLREDGAAMGQTRFLPRA